MMTTVLADRGYPMDSFKQRTADLSFDYPEVVEHYRRAHGIYRRTDDGTATNDDRTRANCKDYRAVLDDIGRTDPDASPAAPAAAAARRCQNRSYRRH